MNIIEATLAQVPRPDGFISAHLVELATGEVLGGIIAPDGATDSAGHSTGTGTGPDDPVSRNGALAATVTECVQQLAGVIAQHWIDDDLEDLLITMTRHHHLVRLLPDLGGTDALLLVTLDRSRANLALARHLLLRLETDLVP